MPTSAKKAFPIKNVVINTFDEKLNGLNEHSIGFQKVVFLALDDPHLTYADLLRNFALYLIKEGFVHLDDQVMMLQIKTNTVKKVSLSCLVDLRKDVQNAD